MMKIHQLILLLFLKRDNSFLVVGMSDGAISFQKRKSRKQQLSAAAANQPKRADNSEYKVKKVYQKSKRDTHPRTKEARATKVDMVFLLLLHRKLAVIAYCVALYFFRN